MRSEERSHWDQIEREVQGETYAGLLARLRQAFPTLRRFTSWAEAIAFMRERRGEHAEKNEILRAIFQLHALDRDHRWRTIILAMFLPGLASIHAQKAAWDPDPAELWQNIVWTFLEVTCRIDVAKRPDRLPQKLINDTVHRLHDEYQRRWKRSKWETVTDPAEFGGFAARSGGIDFDRIDLGLRQEREVERLHKHMEAGRISEADFLLLVGTRVYGKLVREYAQEAELPFQTAKKRRQRAEAAIRRFERTS